MTLGVTAFMTGVAVFLAVYAVLAPRVDVPRDDLAVDVFAGAGVSVPATGGMFHRYVRPALRNFLPQTPMAGRLKARRDPRIVDLLVRSGNPWNIQPEEYYGLRLLFGLVGGFAGLLLGLDRAIPLLPTPAVILLGVGTGFSIPRVFHDRRRGARRKAARTGLPEALDLLVITMNAGMNFQPALAEVAARLPAGLIKDELGRVTQDLRSGSSLTQAMTDFARRAPSEEVESFCAAVLQSERLGSDVSDTLSGQAEAARVAYEAALDVRIGKLPTTLFFPILILMLPSLFLIILAPAFANLANSPL